MPSSQHRRRNDQHLALKLATMVPAETAVRDAVPEEKLRKVFAKIHSEVFGLEAIRLHIAAFQDDGAFPLQVLVAMSRTFCGTPSIYISVKNDRQYFHRLHIIWALLRYDHLRRFATP